MTRHGSAATRAVHGYFLANADRGDNAANDELVTELVRRIRAQQGSSDGGDDRQPSHPARSTPAGDDCRD